MFLFSAIGGAGSVPRLQQRPARQPKRLWVYALVGLGLISAAASGDAGSASVSSPVETAGQLPDELRTGQVRFHLLTGDPYTAIALNPRPETRQHRLLHAQALLDMGLYQQAQSELESLADSGSEISAHAGLELIRLALRTDQLEQAQLWLDRFLPRLQGDNRQEALFHQAEIRRRQDNLAAAAATLKEMGNNTWTGLGYFNLAAAYTQSDSSSSRPLVALRVATSTAGQDGSAASLDLVDRANLAGGSLALREEDYRKASSFLQRIRLDSYQAPLGLYLHGLAEMEQQNARGALQSWHRARKFPLAFAGAAEAYVAMGQAYDEAGSSSQAADSFLVANAVFEKEQAVLGELAAQIREEGSYQALLNAAKTDDVEWFLADSQTVTAPRLAWLIRFMEDEKAQTAVQRMAELERLERRLRQKKTEFEVLRATVKARSEAARSFSAGQGLDRMRKRIAALQRRLATVQAQTGARGGATVVERELAKARARTDALAQKAQAVPSRLRDSLARMGKADKELDAQLHRIAVLRERSEAALDSQALAFIAEQQKELEHLADRSEQEIARLYEYMAVTRLKANSQREAAQ